MMHVEEFPYFFLIFPIPLRVEGKKWRIRIVVKLFLLMGKIFGVNISEPVQVDGSPFISSWEKEMRRREMNQSNKKER